MIKSDSARGQNCGLGGRIGRLKLVRPPEQRTVLICDGDFAERVDSRWQFRDGDRLCLSDLTAYALSTGADPRIWVGPEGTTYPCNQLRSKGWRVYRPGDPHVGDLDTEKCVAMRMLALIAQKDTLGLGLLVLVGAAETYRGPLERAIGLRIPVRLVTETTRPSSTLDGLKINPLFSVRQLRDAVRRAI